MSEYWKDADDISKAVIGMYDNLKEDEAYLEKAKGVDRLIAFKYHDPDVEMWWDTRGGKFEYGVGEAPGKFDVRMSLSGDDAHRAWSNKLNTMLAITKRKLKIEGGIADLLKLAPIQKTMADAYNKALKAIGKEDIIL